jgi:hypothetical protein
LCRVVSILSRLPIPRLLADDWAIYYLQVKHTQSKATE